MDLTARKTNATALERGEHWEVENPLWWMSYRSLKSWRRAVPAPHALFLSRVWLCRCKAVSSCLSGNIPKSTALQTLHFTLNTVRELCNLAVLCLRCCQNNLRTHSTWQELSIICMMQHNLGCRFIKSDTFTSEEPQRESVSGNPIVWIKTKYFLSFLLGNIFLSFPVLNILNKRFNIKNDTIY